MVKELLRPRDVDDLCEAVASARERGRGLDLRGAGSKAALGRPMTDAAPLDLSAFRGVIDYEPSELVLTAAAATPLAEIEALLRASRQELAFEPLDYGPLLGAAPGHATLGGMIATNASGPRRIKAGAARDHFLGFAGVNGRAEAFKAGGKVFKNVTGYDLSKLLAGSWGTLAAMTEVTLKVLPAPETSATLIVHGLDDEAAARAMSLALGSTADVSAAAHCPAGAAPMAGGLAGGAATALRLEGFAPSVATRLDHLKNLLAQAGELSALDHDEGSAFWRGLRDMEPLWGGDDVIWRLSLAPTDGWAAVEALSRQVELRRCYDWGGGLVWLAVAGDDPRADLVHAAVAALGGHAMLVRAAPAARASGVFSPLQPPLRGLQNRVKAGFDPDGVMSPGRMYADDRREA